MTNTPKKSGILGSLSSSSDESSEYRGNLYFKKKTVVFSGTTIHLKNVSKFEQYGLKYTKRVSDFLLGVSIILALAGLAFLPYGLIFTFLFGLIAFAGLKERMRPKLYGLTIELNSGSRHYFLSKDENGIRLLFDKLSHSIENEETFAVSFVDNRVTITNSNIGAVGENNTLVGTSFS